MTHTDVRAGVLGLVVVSAMLLGQSASWADYGGRNNSNGHGGQNNSNQNNGSYNNSHGNQNNGSYNNSHGNQNNGTSTRPTYPTNPTPPANDGYQGRGNGSSSPQEIGDAPECMSHGSVLPVNNSQVASWKSSTPNQYLARAYVTGRVGEVYPDRNGHKHFSITLDGTRNATLEVVYNDEFGDCPVPQDGQTVSACGDYITSTQATSQYQPSPDGAIIHWVHMSPDLGRHDSGFLTINGSLCGMVNPGPRGSHH